MTNKKKLTYLLIVVVIIFSLFYIYWKNKSQNTVTNIPYQVKTIKDIIPGTTSKDEVIQYLGNPIASSDGILQYKSTSPSRNNEITIQNNKVGFVKEIVSYKDQTNLNDLNKQYGNSDYLYGPDSVNGYYLFYHPDKGIAYLANPISGTVLEIWHFPSTDYQHFITLYASDYSTQQAKGAF